MSRPGDRLRALVSLFFDAETMERFIDPVVADLQLEYAHASRAGWIWRRRRVRLAGYVALARAITHVPLRFCTVLLVPRGSLQFGERSVAMTMRCSFCRRRDSEVEKLVAGPWRPVGRVYICDRCAARTIEVMNEHDAGIAQARTGGLWRRLFTRLGRLALSPQL